MSSELNTIYFMSKFGEKKKEIPFPVSPNLKLMDIVPEISKKLGISTQNICIATMGGQVLTNSDLMKPIKELVDDLGNTFDIIDRGVVGLEQTEETWQRSILDEIVQEFPERWTDVGPNHPAWKDRIKLEIERILKYVNFLKIKKNKPWFKLFPEKNPRYNYLIWTGNLVVPERSEIDFNIKVLLTSEYPKSCPRCFAEEKILDYCGKIFVKNIWKQDGKKYVMICHEHMSKTHAWNQYLGIAHFFIRQVWVWWAAQQNVIIQEYDKKHNQY